MPLRDVLSWSALPLLAACVVGGGYPDSARVDYEDLFDPMVEEIQPFLEEQLPTLLARRSGIDYDAVHKGAMRMSYLFAATLDDRHDLYLKKEKSRAAAKR